MLSLGVVRPLMSLVRVTWALAALPSLTGWLPRLFRRMFVSDLQVRSMMGRGVIIYLQMSVPQTCPFADHAFT